MPAILACGWVMTNTRSWDAGIRSRSNLCLAVPFCATHTDVGTTHRLLRTGRAMHIAHACLRRTLTAYSNAWGPGTCVSALRVQRQYTRVFDSHTYHTSRTLTFTATSTEFPSTVHWRRLWVWRPKSNDIVYLVVFGF